MILVGIILLFFGSKFIEATIYIGCILIVMSAAFIIVFDIIYKNGAEEKVVWIVGGISIFFGIILGCLFNKFIRIFFTLFGAYLGYITGILLYNLFVHNIDANQTTLYWSTIGVCAVVFIIVSYIMYNYVIIFSTSLIGSYSVIRVKLVYLF